MDRDADISETAKGDHLAFGRIVVAHQDRVFAYPGRMGLDSATAEDIAQETFPRVWRHAGKYNPRLGSLTTWVLTIARNLTLTMLSQPGRRAEPPIVLLFAGSACIHMLAADIVRQQMVQAFKIPTAAMEPGMLRGDTLFADKRYNCPGCKERAATGDIGIFVYPNDRTSTTLSA